MLQARLDKAHDRHIVFAAAESVATTRRRAMALERKRRMLDADNTSTVNITNSTGIYMNYMLLHSTLAILRMSVATSLCYSVYYI
jgi:hypothetical protein